MACLMESCLFADDTALYLTTKGEEDSPTLQKHLNVSVGVEVGICKCQVVQVTEAGQLGLIPTRPVSQLGLGSARPGQLGLLFFPITGGVFYKYIVLLDIHNDFYVDILWICTQKI